MDAASLDRLLQLSKLRESGALTDAEFTRAKQLLLGIGQSPVVEDMPRSGIAITGSVITGGTFRANGDATVRLVNSSANSDGNSIDLLNSSTAISHRTNKVSLSRKR